MAYAQSEYTDMLNSTDFVRRIRHGNIRGIGIVYLIILGLIVACMVSRNFFPSETLFLVTVLALAAMVALHAIYSLQRNIDLITEVEFQNALFSSSLAKHSEFCLIVRKDGHFAYADKGFAAAFPGFTIRDRSLQSLLETAGAARSDAERLYEAMAEKRRDWFMFTLTDTEGKTRQMILNLYPLNRPEGFFLIQGREVVERRAGATSGAEPENTKNIGDSTYRYMLYLFNEMPMGAYVLSPSGHIRVANRVLEQWLGYETEEISRNELTFEDLLYEVDHAEAKQIDMQEYNGTVTLARKNGSLFKARLDQHVVKDAQDNIIAVIGMLRDNISLGG